MAKENNKPEKEKPLKIIGSFEDVIKASVSNIPLKNKEDKEGIYLLQRIDCNCNDCGFMWRDFDRYKQALEQHRLFQFEAFELKRKKLIRQSDELAKKGKYDDAKALFTEADKMKFTGMTNKTGNIQYGFCEKFNKDVTFIPNTCQIETQKCFIHRKDYTHNEQA